MKNIVLLCLLCLVFSIKLKGQSAPIVTPTCHSDPFRLKFSSFETLNWNGPVSVDIELIVLDTIKLKDSLYWSNPGFNITCNGFNLHDSTYNPGDTIIKTIDIDFDTSSVPLSYRRINLTQAYEQHGAGLRSSAELYMYFTPWRTIEIWNASDFGALNRSWTNSNAASAKAYVAKATLPTSNIPASFEVSQDWEDDFYDVFVDDVGFSVPMMAIHPDSLTQQDSTSANKKPSVFYYNGQVEGNLTAIFSEDGQPNIEWVEHPLAGLDVELWNVGGLIPMGRGVTDMDGNFDFDYSALKSLPAIRVYLKVKARNNEHDISGYSTFAFLRVQRENTGHRTVTYDPLNPNNEEDIDFGNQRFDIGSFRAVSQCYLGFEFVENHSNVDLASGLNITTATTGDNIGNNFFWPDEICPNRPAGAIATRLQGKVLNDPVIVIGAHEDENTIWHEFGHFVMWNLQDKCWTEIITATGDHAAGTEQNPRLEWTEGFADGFMTITDLHYHYVDNESQFDRNTDVELIRNWTNLNGYLSEYYISMAIRDLFDGTTQVTNCHNYDAATPLQPTVVDVANPSNAGAWQNFNDFFEFSLDLIFDAVALGSTVDPAGNGQISSNGEFFANLMQVATCEERQDISIVFQENLITWRPDPTNLALSTLLSSDRIGRDGALETRDGRNGNIEDLFPVLNRLFLLANPTFFNVDFNPLNLEVNVLNATTGNFNFPVSDCITDNLTVEDNATLMFNNSGLGSDWTADNNPFPTSTNIDVDVLSELIIESDGNMVLGDFQHSAVVHVEEIFRLRGDLVVNGNSKLVIEDGGFMELGPDNTITLTDAGSILEIKGDLTIDDFTELTFLGNGKVIFNSSTPDNIFMFWGSSINLQGSGQQDVVAEIKQSDFHILTSSNAVQSSITFKNGKILMGDDTRLATDVDFTIDNCLLEPLNTTDEPRGIYLYGQEDVVIKNSNFKGMRHGIKAEQYYGTEGIEVDNCDFEDCQYGITTWGRHAQLDDCDFTNCEYGWYAQAMTQPSEFYLGTISHTTNDGINYHGGISPLHLRNATVEYSGFSGISYWGNTLSAFCSAIDHNQFGMGLVGTELILSHIVKRATGYVEFDENRHSIVGEFSKLYLEDGKNKLEANQLWRSDRKDIEAYMQPTFVGLGSAVFCDNNQWSAFIDPNTNTPRPPLQPDRNILVQSFDLATLQMQDVPFVYANTLTQRPICPTIVTGGGGEGGITTQYASGLMENPEVPIQTLDFVNTIGVQNHEFEGDDAETAIILSVSDMYFQDTDPDRYEDAVNRLADILMAIDHAEEDPYISFMSEYAYQRMMEGFGFVLKDDKPTAVALSTKVFDVQDRMIDLLEAELVEDTYYGEFKYNMDKALTHHALDDRASALSHLNGMVTNYTDNELLTIQNVSCKVQFEKDVLDGVISILDTEEPGMYLCDDAIVWPDVSSGDPTTIKSIATSNNYAVSHFPNPSEQQSFLRVETIHPSLVRYEILDLSGRSLHQVPSIETNGNYVFTLDQSALNSGSYLLKVYIGDQVERRILVKQ